MLQSWKLTNFIQHKIDLLSIFINTTQVNETALHTRL